MPDYHRGRPRDRDYDRYYDDDDDDDDDYYASPERRPAPKHRSLSRRAKVKLEDKLEDAMEKLGLAESGHSNALVHQRHRSPTPGPGSALVQRRHHSSDHYHSHGDHHHRHRSQSHAHSHRSHRSDGHYHHGSHHSHRPHHRDHSDHHRRRHHSHSHHSRGRDRSRSRDRSHHRHRSLSRWDRSLKSAVDAAALEAFRLRKEPGGWTSSRKTSRIATAAISAAAIGAAVDDKKHGNQKKGELGTIGSAIGGLVVNRVVNGPRKEGR